MVLAVVGDVKASSTLPVIEKYFGQLPTKAEPDERTTIEPPQNSERRVVLKDRSQPLYLEGYHRPGYLDKDDAIYDAIADLMSNGRTSRLYRTLVRDKKIAADSAGFSGMGLHRRFLSQEPVTRRAQPVASPGSHWLALANAADCS